MSRIVDQVGRRPPSVLWRVASRVAIAAAVAATPTHADGRGSAARAPSRGQVRMQPSGPASAKVDARPVRGEWRSHETFDGQARAGLVVQEDGGALAGSLTLLGMTRGADTRATLRLPFRGATWDGRMLSFETTLPDNEGTTRWALRIEPTGAGTLRPILEGGQPIEGGPMWEMRRQ
jgi:hypothetical protein